MKIPATRKLDEDDKIDVTDWRIVERDKLLDFVNQTVNGALEIIAKEPAYVYFSENENDPTEIEIRLPFGPQEGDTLTWTVSLREITEMVVDLSGRVDALKLRRMLAVLLDKLDTALACG